MAILLRPLHRIPFRPRIRSLHASALLYASRKVLQKFRLADIGEGITECEIVKWNIAPNATVQSFDTLCEVQSDKASVEITSPFDGTVTELLVQEGEIAKVGHGLCIIEVDEDAATDAPYTEPLESSSSPFSGSSVASGTSSSTTEPDLSSRPEDAQHPAPNLAATKPRKPHPLDPTNTGSQSVDVLATPSVRHFAKSSGIEDLGVLAPGSGKGGRIERKDVEAYLAGATGSQTSASTPTPRAQEDVVVQLGRTRYGMWKAMEKSLQIPHFGYSTSLDITRLHESVLPSLSSSIPQHFLPETSRKSLAHLMVNPSSIYQAPAPPSISPQGQFTKLTYLPFLLKTLAKAMDEWPLFRSSITPRSASDSEKPTLTVRPNADISLALSTPSGLYTPTLQDLGSLNVFEISSKVKELGWKGRQSPSQLTPADMPRRGGTVTLSNVGAIGKGEVASPVLVEGGGVAIVAIGRAEWKWDVDEYPQGARRLKLPISWSADHRVVEGAELAAFVECWREWVEKPERLVGEGR